jgi:tRNA threonylcarbamoyladenosine biosynthesis protein TsaB
MSFILCIETSTAICSVAVVSEDAILSVCELTEGNAHASMLTSLIEEAVVKAGIRLQQLDAIAISKGPGSYTGLRVGMSTAKGLCFALDKPMLAIDTLQALAARYMQLQPLLEPTLIVPMIDARRMEVYSAVFDEKLHQVENTAATIVDEHSFAAIKEQHKVVFVGNGAGKCEAVLAHPNALFAGDVNCSASGMFEQAVKAFAEKRFEDVAYIEPYYLKDFVGTTPKKRV